MGSAKTSATELLALAEQYAKTEDPEVLKQLEQKAAECPSAVVAAFAPLSALALRNKQITIGEMANRLQVAEEMRPVTVMGDLVQTKTDASTTITDSKIDMGTGQLGGSGNQLITTGGHVGNSKSQILALVLGGIAVLGVSLAAVWVQNPKAVAFIFGVVFIATMLVIALAVPNPTPTQFMIFRTILAICVAGAAALVPGFLEVQVGKWVRAGGAMAVFVIIYFFSPAKLAASGKTAKK